ncbi:MAG: heavy-metal-associated domain-containing protein [Lachnospiraceae bacterium]|nr:heavy-metal-associated domain-containing protein [Lachnospiraceae bacterium]
MELNLSNVIIIIVFLLIVSLAVKGSVSHFKGEGGCCGGGGKDRLIKPKKLDKVVATKVIGIDGMMCDHCAARIHNALNSMEGVNAKVQRSRGRAVVKLGREIDDFELEKVITDLGYTVTGNR